MSDSAAKKFIILAAVDLNPGSTLVLERAIDLASTQPNAEIHAVTVVEPELPLGVYPGILPADLQSPNAERTAEFCREIVNRVGAERKSERLPSVLVHAVVGWAADEIIWLAAHLDADYIVMATHGRKGLKRLLVGSVAEKVVRLAGCPVVVVREKLHNAAWRIPEIEPLCPDCAKVREETKGEKLWCERHSEHHVRRHAFSYGAAGEDSPHAWSSSTGT
ncbi:MAG: universal stress protein [Polyangiaceae bacterium]|jgi:nucleotide-binding universal stress UspA family protein|nr:universal stress protein [Polyangiaceae bacterium]